MDSFISKLIDQYSQLIEVQIETFSFNMCRQEIELDPILFINQEAGVSIIILQNYNKRTLDALLQAPELLNAYLYYYSVISDDHFILVFSNNFIELPEYLQFDQSLFLAFRTYSSQFLVVSTLNIAEVTSQSIGVPPDAVSDKTYPTQVKDIDNIIVGTTVRENDTFTETHLLQEPLANFKPTGVFSGPKRYNDAFERYYPSKIYVSNYFRTLSYSSVGLYSRYEPVCLNLLLESKLIDFDEMRRLIGANISEWTRAIKQKMAFYHINGVRFSNVELNEALCEDLVIDADSVVQISFFVPDFFRQFVRVEFVRHRLSKISYRVHLLITEEYVQHMEALAFEPSVFDIVVTFAKQIPEIKNFPVTQFANLRVEFELVPRPYGLSFNSLAYIKGDGALFGRRILFSKTCFSEVPRFPEIIVELITKIDPVAYALGQDARNAENVENLVRIVRYGMNPLETGEFEVIESKITNRNDLSFVVRMLAFKLLNEAFFACQRHETRKKVIEDAAECLFGEAGEKEVRFAEEWLESDWRLKMRCFI